MNKTNFKDASEPSQETKPSSKKNYTQVPNVLLDRCTLPDEIIMFYIRLARHTCIAGRHCVFTGSVKVLGELLTMKTHTLYRYLNTLAENHLASVSRYQITMETEALWALNELYDAGEDIPPFKDLEEACQSFANLQQAFFCKNVTESCKNVKTFTKMQQTFTKMQQTGTLEQPIERVDEAPNTSNTSKIKKIEAQAPIPSPSLSEKKPEPRKPPQPKSEKTAPPEVVFTPDGQAAFNVYGKHPRIKVPPKDTPKVREQFNQIGKWIKTEEQLKSLFRWMDKDKYFHGKFPSPGLMLQAINEWAMTQEPIDLDEKRHEKPAMSAKDYVATMNATSSYQPLQLAPRPERKAQ